MSKSGQRGSWGLSVHWNLLLGSSETPWPPDACEVLPGTKSGDIKRSVLYGAHLLWVRQSSATLLAEVRPAPTRWAVELLTAH